MAKMVQLAQIVNRVALTLAATNSPITPSQLRGCQDHRFGINCALVPSILLLPSSTVIRQSLAQFLLRVSKNHDAIFIIEVPLFDYTAFSPGIMRELSRQRERSMSGQIRLDRLNDGSCSSFIN